MFFHIIIKMDKMMLTEIFYPHSLKETLIELRKSNNLNNNALQNLNTYFFIDIIGVTILFFILSLFVGHFLVLCGIGLTLGLIRARYNISKLYENELLPYAVGQIRKGHIKSRSENNKRIAKYEYKDNHGLLVQETLIFNDTFERLTIPDGNTDIYIHKKHSIPFIENRFFSRCLNLQRIQEIEKRIDSCELNGY